MESFIGEIKGKKYFGFYKDDLKQGFGVYVWNFDPIEAYIGFWEKRKIAGLGIWFLERRKN